LVFTGARLPGASFDHFQEQSMQSRIDYTKVSPNAVKAMFGLQAYVNHSSLPHSLASLVKMRASQLNGCAFCIDMHSKDARAEGETEQRLYALDAWRETPFYTPKERAALAWTEAVTLIHQGHAPDAVYAEVREHFSESELVDLTLAIVAINGWNRLSIAFRTPPGSYVPGKPVLSSLAPQAA
jgi:AhpD family alkylhydroperoxidase